MPSNVIDGKDVVHRAISGYQPICLAHDGTRSWLSRARQARAFMVTIVVTHKPVTCFECMKKDW